jgi:hypothetical protein
MKLNSLSYLASILLLLFCFLLQLISALQPVSTPTRVEIVLKKHLERRQDKLESPPNELNHPLDGKSPPLTPKKDDMTTTEINITLTTIVYGSAQPTIHNASNTAAARQQQQQQQATSPVSDPNGESLKSKLEEDQAALRRMIMILSLVGGLGVIAVVATVVIFTRMRARNRKQRENEEEGNEDSTYELSGGMDQHSETSISPDSTQNSNPPSNHDNEDNNNNDDNDDDANNQHIEPSAPPALMMTTVEGPSSFNNTENQRHVVSMQSQTAAPSAPTAKELDAMIDEEASQQPTTSNYHSHSRGMCGHCSPTMAPELPPPAYTPSAPPHYALPIEPVMATHNESSPVLSPRRHSLGS